LISQRILFIRLMALARGRQRCIHGAVVNVPSNVSSAVTALPRTPGQAGLIALKLKRRLRYKDYVMHQFVRPDVLLALEWLLDNSLGSAQAPPAGPGSAKHILTHFRPEFAPF